MSQWELLVTEGHVRAERWRNAVPVLFAAAVVAVIVGIGITVLLPKAESSGEVAEAQNAYVAAEREAISAFLLSKGGLESPPPNGERALTRETAPVTTATLLVALGASGRLPETVVRQNPQEFWAGDWQPGAVHAVEKGRTILIGYLVDTSYRYPGYRTEPQLQRAFGIFRRSETTGWSYACLAVPGAQPCETQPVVDPSTIPATMRDLLPSEAFARERQSQ